MQNITNIKGFKIIHLNIRSLWKNQHEFFLQFKGFDIIALSETWLHYNIPNCLIEESGYSIIRQDRSCEIQTKVKSKGGGLIFYVKNCYSEYITKLDNTTPTSLDLEHMWLSIDIPFRRKIMLGLCYRPPSGNIIKAMSLMTTQLEIIDISPNIDCLIVGDLNINYLDRNSIGFKHLKEFERRFLLHQLIDTPTRIHNKCCSLIDHIFTNIDNIIQKGTIDVGISDHLPIFLIIKKCRKTKHISKVRGRSFKKYDTIKFQQYILNDPQWNKFWVKHDVNLKWKSFSEILTRAADEFCPIVSMKLHSDNEGWFTKEVIEAIVEKKRIFKLAKNTGNHEHWSLFRKQRKYTRKLMSNTKEEFLKAQIEVNRDNPRSFWKKLNGIIGNTKNNQSFTAVFNDIGNKIEKVEAAEFMNDYFTEIGEKLNNSNNTMWSPHSFFPSFRKNDFVLNVVNEDVVRKYVKSLDITKPSGITNLNNKLLCDAFIVLIQELTTMFNDSIIQEVFPLDWKMGTITPIPKTGNLMLKTNWRPITILNTLGKLLEKIVHFQTSTYLKLHEILNDDQHGFRKGFSTSSAICEFLTDIYDAKLKNMVTGCLFIDYQKAFDTISHSILFKKMALYGFSKSCINWFKSYLSNRSQMTKCDTLYLSSPKAVTIGVPQGSTLGPLLFILYVNDLCHIKHLFNVELKMYADDTVVYAQGGTVAEVQQTLQSCMDYVYEWCIQNRLYMNMKKTKTMWFEAKQLYNVANRDYEVIINGTVLSRVYSYLYLGVELDDNLTYDKHLTNVVNKTTQKLYIFRKVRKYISQSTAIIVYKQMILPLLEYCNFLFNSGKKSKLDKIDKIQSKCVRIIENCLDVSKRENETALCNRYNLDTLQNRRDIQLACVMYRLSKFDRYIDHSVQRANLRSENKTKFKCTFTKITKIRKSPFYRGVDLWNSLKVEHHKAENKKRFKDLLKNPP